MRKMWSLGLAACVLAVGCAEWKTGGNIGGANQGVRSPGNRQGGIALADGDVAVSPDGRFFVTLKDGTLVTGNVGEEATTEIEQAGTPERVSFWAGEQTGGIVVLSKTDGGALRVFSYDREAGQVLWARNLSDPVRWIDVTSDGRRVVLTGVDVEIADAANGNTIATHQTMAVNVRDVDITKDGSRVIITEDLGGASSRVSVRNTEDGSSVCETTVANCADELVLSDDENRAFLAPVLCQQDPVTVLSIKGDNGACAEEETLPGFGPVALSPDGKTALAFIDRDSLGAFAGTPPQEVVSSPTRFHLMYIDAESLSYRTEPFGQEMPRYAFTPDGAQVLVDSPVAALMKTQIIDVDDGQARQVSGPPVKLHLFSFSADSSRAFLIDDGLFELDINNASLKPVFLDFIPTNLNITPDGNTLLIGNKARRVIHFIDAATQRETARASY